MNLDERFIRRATLNNLDFLAAALVEAERSGSPRGLYERVFEVDGSEMARLFAVMLREEVAGSELCADNLLGLHGWRKARGVHRNVDRGARQRA